MPERRHRHARASRSRRWPGAQGEFAGVAMIRAYHESRSDDARTEIIDPERRARHEPGHRDDVRLRRPRRSRSKADGDVDVEALRAEVGPHTAGTDDDEPVHVRRVRTQHRRHREDRPRAPAGCCTTTARTSTRSSARCSPGDMGFDVHAHEPAQDVRDAARRWRPGCGSGWRVRTAACRSCRFRWSARDGDTYRWLTEARSPADDRPPVRVHAATPAFCCARCRTR